MFDILLAILQSIRRQAEIRDFYPYVWSIARRTYADFSCRRREMSDRLTPARQRKPAHTTLTGVRKPPASIQSRTIWTGKRTRRTCGASCGKSLSFPKIYRDVMVLYYLDGIKNARDRRDARYSGNHRPAAASYRPRHHSERGGKSESY